MPLCHFISYAYMNKTLFERNSSLEYYHMTYTGKLQTIQAKDRDLMSSYNRQAFNPLDIVWSCIIQTYLSPVLRDSSMLGGSSKSLYSSLLGFIENCSTCTRPFLLTRPAASASLLTSSMVLHRIRKRLKFTQAKGRQFLFNKYLNRLCSLIRCLRRTNESV